MPAVIEFIGGGNLTVEHGLDQVYSEIVNARGDLLRLDAAGGGSTVVRVSAIAYVAEPEARLTSA
jgi:hypothetical protein